MVFSLPQVDDYNPVPNATEMMFPDRADGALRLPLDRRCCLGKRSAAGEARFFLPKNSV
jgi:hypothetical protein